MKQSIFYSKVLLFGEYGIIENSIGLSIPYNFYKGSLKFLNSTKNKEFFYSNLELKKYYKFLFFLKKSKKNLVKIDLKKLQKDIQKGIYFKSNIPKGYGIGSSGALVSSIYDKYAKKKLKKCLNNKNIIILKKIFSQMESFFHGKSSGIDPLICYFNKPLLIRSSTNISTIKIPEKNKFKGKGAIFLLDTGFSRKTSFMIEKFFFVKLKNDEFKKILKEEFMKYNEKCIESFLKGNFKIMLKNVKLLSNWVFIHFRPMIPKIFWKIWKKSLFTDLHYLKLCGSGGGGFILGFTPNYDISKKILKKYTTEVLFRF
ncbi:GHMP family kinase ATP-binding protein [Blattabacterium punctulatus]|uniref:GHMP family kinase ATP-binding protein n=1 Tax=Blattabacterium punctulatus TaxID=164514 RepID=UPI000D7C5F8A|nr:mevalonate kinase [Blattabacterium punctulatus]AWU44120.1 mevalonate kinase [Blattabacterium punctulatus]AWU45207.1 mevalonate kinase [Blattabacterium punctulatus]